MNRHYITRQQSRALALDHPVGDAFGGPAYGEFLDVGSVFSAGSQIVGGLIGADAASSAADAQAQAARDANATQLQIYNQTREDNAPFRQNGVAASNKLAQLLGTGGSAYSTSAAGKTRDQLRAELLPSYTKTAPLDLSNQWVRLAIKNGSNLTGETSVDEQALNAAIDQQLAQQSSAAQAAQQNDPSFGSLLRNFSQADLAADPIYQNTIQFALDQGAQGINRQAAATGSMLSGNTLKALTRFGANTAATYGNDAYNRFNTNKNNTYNYLAGVSGAGQAANNQVAASGGNYANQVSNNLTSLGNARGASAIAQGNALSGALSSIGNTYQQNNLLNSLSYQPNAYGSGTGSYSAYAPTAVANGGWGIE